MKKDKEVKTLQNGGKQELQSCTDSGILLVTSEVLWEVVLHDLVFFFQHELCRVILHLQNQYKESTIYKQTNKNMKYNNRQVEN